MFYVYFLKSLKNSDLYVGFAEDVEKRLKRHNSGRVRSTKFYKPWELLGYKKYETKEEAIKMEKFFKTHQQKELLKEKYMAG